MHISNQTIKERIRDDSYHRVIFSRPSDETNERVSLEAPPEIELRDFAWANLLIGWASRYFNYLGVSCQLSFVLTTHSHCTVHRH